MPDWSYRGTTGSSGWIATSYTSDTAQQIWDEFQQECEQADRVREQKVRDAEEECHQEQLRQEEMRKYPLFFWKETCEPILDLRKGKLI